MYHFQTNAETAKLLNEALDEYLFGYKSHFNVEMVDGQIHVSKSQLEFLFDATDTLSGPVGPYAALSDRFEQAMELGCQNSVWDLYV